MVRSWQLWLSPRPTRTETPAEGRMLAPEDSALFEYLYQDDGRLVVKETHYADNKAVQEGRSGPPLYVHMVPLPGFPRASIDVLLLTIGQTHSHSTNRILQSHSGQIRSS